MEESKNRCPCCGHDLPERIENAYYRIMANSVFALESQMEQLVKISVHEPSMAAQLCNTAETLARIVGRFC